MKSRFTVRVLVCAFLVLGSVLPGIVAAEDAWRIGTIYPLSGPNAKNGIANFDGVKIATEMINDAGGVLGKKVVLVSADAPEPQAAASEANRLITAENVTALIGTQSSSLSMAATTVAEKNKIFYLETEGISGMITARGFKYLFRTTFNSTMMTHQMVDYAADVLGPEKLGKQAKDLRFAIIHEDGGFGTSSGKGLTQRAEQRGLNIVAVETYSAKSRDLSPLVLKLKKADPDILLAAQYINDSILFHRQAREMGFKPLVLGTTAGQGDPAFYDALGKAAEGILAGGIPSEISVEGLAEGPKKDAKEFVRRYQEGHNGAYPGPTSFVGFAGAWAFYRFILPKAGSLDPEKLREAALSLDIPRGSGVLNWGLKFAGPDQPNAGQNVHASAAINQWQDGKIRLVYPEEIAAAGLK